jgi:uncharacterized phage infection (PIP) family protein YhgE
MSIQDKIQMAQSLAGNIDGFSEFLSSKATQVSQKADQLEQVIRGSRSGESATRVVREVSTVLAAGSNQLKEPAGDLRAFANRLANE